MAEALMGAGCNGVCSVCISGFKAVLLLCYHCARIVFVTYLCRLCGRLCLAVQSCGYGKSSGTCRSGACHTTMHFVLR